MNSDQATVGAFLVAALAVASSALVWLGPRASRFFKSLDRMFETINGRAAELDRAGRETKEAVPSLSAQLADIKHTISDQSVQNERISALETTVAEHGVRLEKVETAHQLERIAGHLDSAQAWKAVEAIASQPGEPGDDLDADRED